MSHNFVLDEEVISDGDINIRHYTSKLTGLRVVIAYVESPIVKGDLVFATEALDDDGLPHTLEHLVFLGSESYPYKGVLDLLANRCLADGTNAYTDTDHTNYTLVTAGSDGFLNLLPIYMDHLLFPTLTDAAYTTEVHHINSKGEDAGVVYCEMQARENTGESRCLLELLRSLYPGKCGYKSETGGLLKNLRESTNNNKVRDYHNQYYRAKNLCVVVTGPVEPEQIFAAIKPIEDKVATKESENGLKEFERPWQSVVETLDSSKHKKIQYPSDTNEDGLVYIGFRGPKVASNENEPSGSLSGYEEMTALASLLDYLNTTATSPIQRDFVECDEPYCSFVSHSVIENSTVCFYLSFESVGTDYLDLVSKKLFELLTNIATGKEVLNLDRLKTMIERKIVRILSSSETSPHSVVIGPIIGHFLYGTNSLKDRCQDIPLLQKFMNFEEKFWLNLIDKYMIGPDARYVCVVGEPSPAEMKSMSVAEEERIARQKEELKKILPELGERLKSAVEHNEIPPPIELLNCVNVPSTDNIKFHTIQRAVVEDKLPFRLHVDSIKTNFISISLQMNTSHLSKTERLYLPLLSEIILECPIERGGRLMPYEEVVEEMFSDTICQDSSIGLSAGTFSTGLMSMLFGISMQVEVSKYEKAIQWFKEILYKTKFTPERIKTVITRLVSDISQYKRSGSKVVGAAIKSLIYQSNSNPWAVNFMRQQKFLKKMLKDLKQNPEEISMAITRVRDSINRPSNFFIHIALNRAKIDDDAIWSPWLKFVPEEIEKSNQLIRLSDIVPCHATVQFPEEPKSVIVGVGSVESNYMHQVIRSLDSMTHPDLPAVYVLIQYLTQVEGPLYRQLRGLGFSYGYSIYLSPSEGLMYFSLAKSTQVAAAYNKAVEIVDSHVNENEEFQANLLDSAKSSLIFEFINREKSAAGKSSQSLIAYLRNLDIDFNKEMIKRIAKVSIDDLHRVGPKYLKPLFHDSEKRHVICCHPSKVAAILNEERFQGTREIVLEDEPLLNSFD